MEKENGENNVAPSQNHTVVARDYFSLLPNEILLMIMDKVDENPGVPEIQKRAIYLNVTSVSKEICDKFAEIRRKIFESHFRSIFGSRFEENRRKVEGYIHLMEYDLVSSLLSPEIALNLLTSIKRWKDIIEPMLEYLEFPIETRFHDPRMICDALQKASFFRFSPTFVSRGGNVLLNEVGNLYRNELEDFQISLNSPFFATATMRALSLDPKVKIAKEILFHSAATALVAFLYVNAVFVWTEYLFPAEKHATGSLIAAFPAMIWLGCWNYMALLCTIGSIYGFYDIRYRLRYL